jgi:hypothetical protein
MRFSRTTLWLAGAVLVLPSLCVVGLALAGRALEENAPAEGHLTSTAEREEARRRFLALPPAEHLAAARTALAGIETGRGRHRALATATEHLDAIAADAGALGPEVAALRAQLDALYEAAFARAISAIPEVATTAPPGQPGLSARCAMFTAIRQRGGHRSFSPGAPFDEGVVVNLRGCDDAALERVYAHRDALRRMNFRRIECAGGQPVRSLEDGR